jgi:hypothetical protein
VKKEPCDEAIPARTTPIFAGGPGLQALAFAAGVVRRRALPLVLGLALVGLLTGCATSRSAAPPPRPFVFREDTFSFPNELVWVYGYDDAGRWKSHARDPKPSYAQHCFVVACAARQFFENARFDPTQPVADGPTYRRLIRSVVSQNPRYPAPEKLKVIIPGYPNLREFSEAQEELLKAECGVALSSYFQRGHWRMVFPFSRRHQAAEADAILHHLKARGQVAIHIVRFPSLAINHAALIYAATESDHQIQFSTYDPNTPDAPIAITFDRSSRTFSLPATLYFPGGSVDVYEVWHAWNY